MNPRDLIKTAEELASSADGKPRQSNLRRSTSTTYYAMFHFLARCCADMLIGSSAAARSNAAWRQVYRSLDHSAARTACLNKAIERFPNRFATSPVALLLFKKSGTGPTTIPIKA